MFYQRILINVLDVMDVMDFMLLTIFSKCIKDIV